MPFMKPRAVFLDLDGVIFDTLPSFAEAWQEAFKIVGLDFPKARTYQEEGRVWKETISRFLKQEAFPGTTDEIINRIHAKKKEHMKKFGTPKLIDGAIDLVSTISKSGMKMLIVTGSTTIEHIEEFSNVFGHIIGRDNIVTGHDVRAGKPNPDPYLLACHIAEVNPNEAIVVENAPLGIRSADAAGTFCLAVNTGPLSDSELVEAGARVVFGSCSLLSERWPEILRELNDE